jgi:8-oxo-dGTP pyrophosphatase MutT (NUDIX family)
MMKPGKIRPLAIGIFRRNDEILVFEGFDPQKGQAFYRPLGGAIEFGEYGHQTLAREVREEIGVEVKDLCYLGISENIFVYGGQQGHEIVLVYEGTLADHGIYERDSFVGHEDDGTSFKVVWKPLEEFRSGKVPLYPNGLLELLGGLETTSNSYRGKGAAKEDEAVSGGILCG